MVERNKLTEVSFPATYPFAHRSQDVDSFNDTTDPAAQSVQLVSPADSANLPGPHLSHSDCPVADWLRPSAHFSHDVWPS